MTYRLLAWCVCLVTTKLVSLYWEYSSELDAVSLQADSKRDVTTAKCSMMCHSHAFLLGQQVTVCAASTIVNVQL